MRAGDFVKIFTKKSFVLGFKSVDPHVRAERFFNFFPLEIFIRAGFFKKEEDTISTGVQRERKKQSSISKLPL